VLDGVREVVAELVPDAPLEDPGQAIIREIGEIRGWI
jgi:hypothetical protein